MARYDWPSTEGLAALVRKHGNAGAAARLGVPPSSLRAHLDKCGVPMEDRRPEPKALNDDALKEIHELLS